MMPRQSVHQPVLLTEAISQLAVFPNGVYIDATFGQGGHSAQVLTHLGMKGRLLAIDKDPEAVACAQRRFGHDKRLTFYPGSFSSIGNVVAANNLVGQVDGILLDLGVSTPQLETPARGFSFLHDGPLDMRMDPNRGMTAAQWLAHAKEDEMVYVFKKYGEERFSKRIARAIVQARRVEAITTTTRLANIVSGAHPHWEIHKHPATRVFQAIRIHINHELDELQACLQQSLEVLSPGGRLGVISFHSLEDRLVKRFIGRYSRPADELRDIPLLSTNLPLLRLKSLGRGIKPQALEVACNPRSRSATLRVTEKLR